MSLPRGVRDRSAARLLFGDATALPRVDALENSDAVDEDAGILLFDSALFNFAASILALGGRVRTWSALDRLAGGRFLVFLAGDGGAEPAGSRQRRARLGLPGRAPAAVCAPAVPRGC